MVGSLWNLKAVWQIQYPKSLPLFEVATPNTFAATNLPLPWTTFRFARYVKSVREDPTYSKRRNYDEKRAQAADRGDEEKERRRARQVLLREEEESLLCC